MRDNESDQRALLRLIDAPEPDPDVAVGVISREDEKEMKPRIEGMTVSDDTEHW